MLLAPFFLLLPTVCLAGSITGRVTSIFVANDSAVVLFKVDGAFRETPRCNESGYFAIHTAKKGGVNVYRAILEAKAQQYTVEVLGLNTCTTNWKAEDVRNIEIR